MLDLEEEQVFLAAIRAAPEEDEPRHRYGEWLRRQGDPQGDFILVQLELSRASWDHPDRPRLSERQDEIQRQHPELRDLKGAWAFSRGLVSTAFVTQDFADTVDPAAFRRAAITSLAFPGPLVDAARVEALQPLRPWLCPRWLHSRAPWSEEALGRLLDEGYLRSLRCLVLNGTGLGDGLATRIAESESVSSIERLHLAENGIGPRGASALAASKFLGKVSSLSLESNQVDAEGVRALLTLPALAKLDLSGNPLGASGVSALCGSAGAERLICLRLADARLNPEAIRIIAATPALARLEHLALSRNLTSFPPRAGAFRQDPGKVLSASPYLSRTMALELDGASLGLSWGEWTDWGIPVGEGWDGQPPAELAGRFKLVITRDGDPNHVLGPFSAEFAGDEARGARAGPPG